MPVTRSFGQPMAELAHFLEGVWAHTARAGEKLRAHGLAASVILDDRRDTVFLARHGIEVFLHHP